MKIACIFEVRPVQSARVGHVRLGTQHKWPIRRNVAQSRASAFSPTHPPFASRCSRIDGQRTDKRAFRHDMTRSPSAFLFFYLWGGSSLPRYIRSRILTLQLDDAVSSGGGGTVAIASAVLRAFALRVALQEPNSYDQAPARNCRCS